MLKYYSELTHHSSPKLNKTITFGGEVVETDPIIIQTQPDDESFKLIPGLLTEEEVKAYILDIVNNHVADYNNIIGNNILTENVVSKTKEILSSDYRYSSWYREGSSGCYFAGSGWTIYYNRQTGVVDLLEQPY